MTLKSKSLSGPGYLNMQEGSAGDTPNTVRHDYQPQTDRRNLSERLACPAAGAR